MPEILEVETARALIEARGLARPIRSVAAPDAWFLKRGLTPRTARAALRGRSLVAARRRGKLLLVDTSAVDGSGDAPKDAGGPTVGMHLGMSGRVVIDGEAAGDPLLYASNRENPAWHRFGLRFVDGGSLWLRDPRRLGAVELEPDEERLGPDALTLDRRDLDAVVTRSRGPVKAALMDQSRIAGLGNLLTDEALWRAGIDPARPAVSLAAEERGRLHRAIRTTLRTLARRGGSHTGDHMVARVPGASCPRDGAPMLRRTIGGRTTYSCSEHQV